MELSGRTQRTGSLALLSRENGSTEGMWSDTTTVQLIRSLVVLESRTIY